MEVFEEINSKEKIRFKFISKEDIEKGKISYASNVWYSPDTHTITFLERMESINLLLFECCNAFQRRRFLELGSKIGWDNIPDRNTYGVLKEKTEYHSMVICSKIVKYGIKHLRRDPSMLSYEDPETKKPTSFEKHYLYLNRVSQGEKISHTESYRLHWDQAYTPLFFLKYSEELEKYPELLYHRCSKTDNTLLDLVILNFEMLFQTKDIKTKKEILIALTNFITRWYNQKKILNFQNAFESYCITKGCFSLVLDFHEKVVLKAFTKKIEAFLTEEQTKPPLFDINLKKIDPSILPHFNLLLKVVKQKIKESLIANNNFSDLPLNAAEKIPLMENKTEKNDEEHIFDTKMIKLLNANFFKRGQTTII